jgi:hypothetical protein
VVGASEWPAIRPKWRRVTGGLLVGGVGGVVLTVVAVVVTFGVSMAQNASWGVGFLARATVTDTEYSLSTGPGVLIVPVVAAALGALVGLLLSRRHT